MTATERSRRWREANREHSRAYMREYMRKRRLSPEQRAKESEAMRKRYAENADWWRERSRRWAKENPEKACAAANRRRARKLAAPGHYTADEFAALCVAHDHRCVYCGSNRKNLTADHVIPLTRGGTNYISNILPACKPCNSSKGSLTAKEFLARKGA